MTQENAIFDINLEFGITAEERERYNDYLHISYINKKLAKAKTFAATNPDAWTDGEDLLAEWEQWDKEDVIYEG